MNSTDRATQYARWRLLAFQAAINTATYRALAEANIQLGDGSNAEGSYSSQNGPEAPSSQLMPQGHE